MWRGQLSLARWDVITGLLPCRAATKWIGDPIVELVCGLILLASVSFRQSRTRAAADQLEVNQLLPPRDPFLVAGRYSSRGRRLRVNNGEDAVECCVDQHFNFQ
jgi:hypothetical protein